MSSELVCERRDDVLLLIINRPERRNALNSAVISGILDGLRSVRDDRALRAIVLTASGDAAFCAGAELQTGKSFTFDFSRTSNDYSDLLREMQAAEVPLIARIIGSCLAGGMGLLAACDVAFAVEHAMFGLPEVRVGVFPMQVLAQLKSLVPKRALVKLCLSGESITAAEAERIGLVTEVCSSLDQSIDRFLENLRRGSSVAVRRGLYAIKAVEFMTFAEAMAFTEGQIALVAQTADAQEGLAAFREKRSPNWPNA